MNKDNNNMRGKGEDGHVGELKRQVSAIVVCMKKNEKTKKTNLL